MICHDTARGVGSFLRAIKKKWVGCQQVSCNFLDFHLPDIASLPAGLFSTPTKLSWRHACIAPLPADLFSIPTGLQTLPIALIDIFIFLFFCRWLSGVTLKNLDIFIIFFRPHQNF
jgi:hypothetical protein